MKKFYPYERYYDRNHPYEERMPDLRYQEEEAFMQFLVFLGIVNLVLALVYFTFPFVRSSASSLWRACVKRRRQRPMEVTVSPPPLPPTTTQPRDREAPPPPYHIAVDSSTPPPSYFDLFDK